MIKITEEFIKKLEIYKEINLHSNMGWTVTPGDQEQSTAAGLESIGKHPFELHLEKPVPGKTFCFLKTSGEIRGIEKYLREKEERNYRGKVCPVPGSRNRDVLNGDKGLSEAVMAELRWKAAYDTYIFVAEQIIDYIKNNFQMNEGKIAVYMKNELLIAEEDDNASCEDHPAAVFRQVRSILACRCGENRDVAVDAYNKLAGTKQASFGSDTLNSLVLLGKLMLLDELIGDTPPDCFKTSQGVTSVTHRGKTYIWDYTGGKIMEKEI